MGPCPFRHGNDIVANDLMAERWGLQWGHVLSDMVTWWEKIRMKIVTVLQWGHVLSDMVTTSNPSGNGWSSVLQWGHVLSDMVTLDAEAQRYGHATHGFNGAMSFQTW